MRRVLEVTGLADELPVHPTREAALAALDAQEAGLTAEATELRLGLAARAENLALVRQALAGFGDAVAIADGPLADLKQIATEACMNAVVHAYPGRRGGPDRRDRDRRPDERGRAAGPRLGRRLPARARPSPRARCGSACR